MSDSARVVTDALAIVAVSAVLAGVVNTARDDGLPWVAREPYEVFVPCPEPLGEVQPLAPGDPLVAADSRALRLDARDAAAWDEWHLAGAWRVEFDWVTALPDDVVRRIASSGAATVVVYGDGGDPDSGRELARELAGRGIRNVRYVEGGAAALREGRR